MSACFAADDKEQRLKGVVDQDKTEQKEEKGQNPKTKAGDKGEKGQVAPLGIELNLCRFNTPPQPGPSQSLLYGRHS